MSTDTMQKELALVLAFRQRLLARKPQNQAIELYDAIEPELLKLLYAQNKDLADLAHHKIQTILIQNLDAENEADQQLKDLSRDLYQQRIRYLTPVAKGFLGEWAEGNWIGANFALLAFPLLAAPFFPFVGIPLLVYTAVVAGTATVDVVRKSPDYWLEEDAPGARELTQTQRDAFAKQYQDIDVFLPENNPQKNTFKSMNRQSYVLYVLALGIALIGLGALLFPPIGIPTLALTILSVIALVSTGWQAHLLLEKQKQTLMEIDQEHQAHDPTQYEHHDSAAFIQQHLPHAKTMKQVPIEDVSKIEPTPQTHPQPKADPEETSDDHPHIHP